MDNLLAAHKEKWLFFSLLAVVVALIIYSPLRHGYIYPTGGDDTANHIIDLINLTENLDYSNRSITYYGISILLPFTLAGLNPFAVFSVFNYLVIIGVFCSMWLLLRKFYGFLSAVLGFPVSVFMVMSTWYYFDDGTIFAIFNLWVIGLAGLYAGCRWLEEGKPKWLILAGILFILTSVVHSATYLYIMASLLLFSAGFALWHYRKQNIIVFKRTVIFAAVFCVSIISAWLTWMHTLLPRLTGAMVETITGEREIYTTRVDIVNWIGNYLNIGTAAMILIAILMLIIVFKKGQSAEIAAIKNRLTQPLSLIIACFLFVLCIGTFTKLGYNYDRFARDMATFAGLVTAILLAQGLGYYRYEYRKVWIVIAASLFILTCSPVHFFLSDYTALRPCDRQAIEYLNNMPEEPVIVHHFSTLSPRIYSLYTNQNVTLERTYNLSEYENADLVIHRNNHMTYFTLMHTKKDDFVVIRQILDDQPHLEEIASFQSGVDEIVIYSIKKDVTG